MKRLIDLILVAAVLVGAVWTYQIKHEAEMLSKKRSSLKAQIAAQERKILLLQADWALETSPGRLAILAKRYADQLDLAPLASTQIATVEELPAMRQERDDSRDETRTANKDQTSGQTSGPTSVADGRVVPNSRALSGGGIDQVVTGGISDLIDRELTQ